MTLDPFDGFFDAVSWEEKLPAFLDMPRARNWLEMARWSVEKDLYTYQQPLQGRSGNRVRTPGHNLIMASSYDYLGLIGHPDIDRAAIEAVREFGTGTGGVRLLTGTCQLHTRLEAELAMLKGVEAATVYTSGYMANLAAISALANHKDRVIVDEQIHRSIIDGCNLARTEVQTFDHNDVTSLENRLKSTHRGRALVIVEGVYSMDGDICPLPDVIALKKHYEFTLMVDEAHSIGVLGARGRGVDEHFGISASDVDIWMGALSKAIPANGGYLAGSRALMIYLRHESAPFMFSAALCPAAAAASLAALKVIHAEPWRVRTLHERAGSLRTGLKELGLDTGRSRGPIIPLMLGGNERTLRFARALLDRGILASAVIHPAVQRDRSRLRLCAMASHSEGDIDAILTACAAVQEDKSWQ